MKCGDVCEITLKPLGGELFPFCCPALILFAQNGEQLASASTFCSSDGVPFASDPQSANSRKKFFTAAKTGGVKNYLGE
jgi:hypothetical protein